MRSHHHLLCLLRLALAARKIKYTREGESVRFLHPTLRATFSGRNGAKTVRRIEAFVMPARRMTRAGNIIPTSGLTVFVAPKGCGGVKGDHVDGRNLPRFIKWLGRKEA